MFETMAVEIEQLLGKVSQVDMVLLQHPEDIAAQVSVVNKPFHGVEFVFFFLPLAYWNK